MTTFEPGARDAFTHGLTSRPRSTAFLASRPAAIITDGLEVLVQLVIAAMTTCPWSSSTSAPPSRRTGTSLDGRPGSSSSPSVATGSTVGAPGPFPSSIASGSLAGKVSATASSSLLGATTGSSGIIAVSACRNENLATDSGTRSWGRLGPARLGSTVVRSSSNRSVYTGSGESGVWNRPCSLAYASTRATRSGERPVNSRYLRVSSSTGKIATVEPYSGDMLPMVARLASGTLATPGP